MAVRRKGEGQRALRLQPKGAGNKELRSCNGDFVFFPRLLLIIIAVIIAATGLKFLFF